jgi:hypothetical protein
MPNNLDPVPTSINFSLQQLIVAIANIPPTIDAPVFVDSVGEFFRVFELAAFVDSVGEFFRVFELEFLVKSFEKNLQLTPPSFDKRMKPSRCFT